MKINVYSEVTKLKEVVVHTPGEEIAHVDPMRLKEFLFSTVIEPKSAIDEHKRFVKILEDNGVIVHQIDDLIVQTYDAVDDKIKRAFIESWLDHALPKLSIKNRLLVKKYILSFPTKAMVRKMIAGIRCCELNLKGNKNPLVVDPMPNICFARDTFASIGDGVSIHNMKYPTRKREALLTEFVFKNHPDYKTNFKYYDNKDAKGTIEGGDIFVYNEKTLVIGNSERTNMDAIKTIAKSIKSHKTAKFEQIVAINVPPMPNLMHLDTWLTMVDYDKFLYSPNILQSLKFWVIDLKKPKLELVEKKANLKTMLKSIIRKEPILIPVGGEHADQLDIDVETHFDATNYLTIAPGVVVGYDRNVKTEAALKKAGVKVLSFSGNQLSLAMGSARCLSMPLVREN